MASVFCFVWDGNVLLHETFKKDNSENTELTTWVFEENSFVPAAKLVGDKSYSILNYEIYFNGTQKECLKKYHIHIKKIFL